MKKQQNTRAILNSLNNARLIFALKFGRLHRIKPETGRAIVKHDGLNHSERRALLKQIEVNEKKGLPAKSLKKRYITTPLNFPYVRPKV